VAAAAGASHPSPSTWRRWRRLEGDRRRPHLEPIFDDQPTGSIGVASPSRIQQRYLRRQRRGSIVRTSRPATGCLQVGRRWRGPWAHRLGRARQIPSLAVGSAPSPDRVFNRTRGAPAGPIHYTARTRSAGSSARPVFERPDVPGGPLQGREHRRQRRRHRSMPPKGPPVHTRRYGCGREAAGTVGENAMSVGRARAAALPVPRTAPRTGAAPLAAEGLRGVVSGEPRVCRRPGASPHAAVAGAAD
jgi:hypothetical protein